MLVVRLAAYNKFCTPAIAPDGTIKLGESALCPSIASIYDSEEDIINKIKNCNCQLCKIPWDRLKLYNYKAYDILIRKDID